MKSPFPGMDPYLEAYWGDVHTRLIVYACDQLQARLPRDLRARVEEHITVDTGPAPNGSAAPRLEDPQPDGYDGYIDYRVDPQPPLQGAAAAWADQLLRQQNRR